MELLLSLLSSLLLAYISLTNQLALWLETYLPSTPDTATVSTTTLDELSRVTTVPGGSIPQILIENAAYQKAAVVESIPAEAATSTAYDALVNIYCEHKSGNTIRVTTGTGFFIDTSGVILTNAHVAHFLLMDEFAGDSECVIRTGNPATARYKAELLYISPAWIRQNAAAFTAASPKGTGERDYALLYVSNSLTETPLPSSFPALPIATSPLTNEDKERPAYVAGYPAGALIAAGNIVPLVPKLATTSVAEFMTFGSNQADVMTVRGTDVGEHGASGGPILTTDGDAIGLISTKGDAERFGTGALRAITLAYIDRTIQEETGLTLRQNLGGNLAYRAQLYAETMVPFLKLVLDQEQE